MRTVDRFPHPTRKIETAWIPMSDGARLAASVWLPEDAEVRPVPAILEYIPYRRRDFTAIRDALHHPYFAGHGYASVRVDMRGSGDSDGVLEDEYLPQEEEDGLQVLQWLAAQSWCNGSLGMMGISWGGFNALQIAARQPPGLKAIVSVASSDDRYSDDIHHMGGCLLGDNLSWASVMLAYNSLPPDPEIVGDRWRQMWHNRLEAIHPWIDIWLRHQRRDAYWRQGSICEDYGAVKCPAMLVSGWADGYSNAVFRMLENLRVPRKALVGPWGHRYPHIGMPGPAIGFLQECIRWWDRWLKDVDNGIDREPMLRAWMQDPVPPTSSYVTRPGRWVTEDTWPSPEIERRVLPLGPFRIGAPGETMEASPVGVQSPLTVGLFAGRWFSFGSAPDLAHDQRQEDGGALNFESELLEEPLEILGAPVVDLELEVNRPLAMVAARLSDVLPSWEVTRVTYGLLNLTHRDGSCQPQELVPGRRYRVRLVLNEIAQLFDAGHRLRLSLSTSYWPLAWAPPEPVRLTVYPAGSALALPIRTRRSSATIPEHFEHPEAAPPLPRTMLEPEQRSWRVIRDLASDVSTLEVINDIGCFRLEPTGLTIRNRVEEWYTSRANDALSLRGETRSVRELSRGDWHIQTASRTVMSSTSSEFVLHVDVDAREGGRRVFCRSWDTRIPRSDI